MSILRPNPVSLALLAGLLAIPAAASAAESLDTCAGFIDSVPTTISTQGVWCLRHDLSTSIASGAAIVVATNNVTIDCNDFKLGGLGGGAATQAAGISASDRLNTTVRHCNIRGFVNGISLTGMSGGSHLVEDNRFSSNTYLGIRVEGDGSVIRRNQINDTGGTLLPIGVAYGIYARGSIDVLDNTISGVLPTLLPGPNSGSAFGVYTYSNPDGSISGNRVRGLVHLGSGTVAGIYNNGTGRISMRNNDLVGDGGSGSQGLRCADGYGRVKDNIVSGFFFANVTCSDAGGNSF